MFPRHAISRAVLGVLLVGGAAASGPPRFSTPRTHTVEISGMEFHPAVLEVERGDTVIWKNRDMVPHTATGIGKPHWDTGPILQDATGRYVALQRGDFPYECRLHPVMTGKLVVK
jgi:plastocyanin